eukprot:CAMPEP_0172629526 /NCGR_PEP_ID=MMETSP1068-20121228/168380_1 /TAXON_ID=35684 /ORGANISM="Pseudopedinella elastica, Strain CCMP716" /LENGTH=69 /DNA_ID=CAMNT_0013440091 /DNA_START=143 /DNA_END=352 /DNA_ORIENTATION=+
MRRRIAFGSDSSRVSIVQGTFFGFNFRIPGFKSNIVRKIGQAGLELLSAKVIAVAWVQASVAAALLGAV